MKNLKLLLALVAISTFLASTNLYSYASLLPFFAQDLHVKTEIAGQAMTLTMGLTTLLSLLAGAIIRRWGYRVAFLVGLITLTGNSAIAALTPAFTYLLVASILVAIEFAMISPLTLTIAATEFPDSWKGRAMSAQIASVFLAVVVGLPLMVEIAGIFQWRTSFALLAIISILIAPFVVGLMPNNDVARSASGTPINVLKDYKSLLAQVPVSLMYAFVLLYVICSFSTGTYLVAYMASKGTSSSMLSIFIASVGMGFVVGTVFAGEMVARIPWNARLLIIGCSFIFVALRASFFLFTLNPIPIAVLLAIASICDGMVAVTLRTVFSRESQANPAVTMSFLEFTQNLGGMLGAAIGGAIIGIAGYTAFGKIVFIIWLMGAIAVVTSRIAGGHATVS